MAFRRQRRSIQWCTGIALCLCFSVGFMTLRESYPQGYFSNPLNRDILLSGTFGELRTNHFHAGVDIKSKNGTVGEDVVASAPGFISRIGVQSSGYGNVLYIDHPNGYTTVYAHLHRFRDDIATYVRNMQYALKHFEVDLYPRPDQFVVRQGEHIGYLGNSGSSSGPHLHFEIRKTSHQLPINPLLFGMHVQDNRYPAIRTLKVYSLDQDLHLLKETNYPVTYISEGQYRLKDTVRADATQIGFALKVFDQMTGASNQNGIYALHVSIDSVPQYRFELNSIPFAQSRYLNAHIDYRAKHHNGEYYHRCFRLPGNALDIYEEQQGGGIVRLTENAVHQVTITALDLAGNASHLTFLVKGGTAAAYATETNHDYDLDYLRSNQIRTSDLHASFEPHTFYQNIRLHYDKNTTSGPGFFAPIHHLLPEDIPVHRYFDMTILSNGIPEHLKSKAFIAEIMSNGKMVSWGGVVHGDYIFSRIRSLGRFSVALDTIPPEVIPITFRSNMQGMSRMRFRISDAQSVTGQANRLSFEATVDGEWILMEYDRKTAMLTHWFDDRIVPGEHELVLRVWDDRGNETRLVRKFVR